MPTSPEMMAFYCPSALHKQWNIFSLICWVTILIICNICWKPVVSITVQISRSPPGVYTHMHTCSHTCVNPRASPALWTEKGKLLVGVWLCLKFPALFIVIKVPPIIPPLLKSPEPYIIIISTKSRERWEKEWLKILSSFRIKTEEEGVQCPEAATKERACCGLEWFSWPYRPQLLVK